MNILQNLKESDPVISNFINSEANRQETHLELIASENFASIAVMQAQGSVLTNKYADGGSFKKLLKKDAEKSFLEYLIELLGIYLFNFFI